jgi:hypothetical protein
MKGEARRMDKERSLVPITRSSGMGMLCFAHPTNLAMSIGSSGFFCFFREAGASAEGLLSRSLVIRKLLSVKQVARLISVLKTMS